MTTLNPWLALPDGLPSPVAARRLRAAHEAVVTHGGAVRRDEVRPVVYESWRRSLGSGVDPDGTPPPVDLLDHDLLAYREAHPLAAVMPVIRRLLVTDAEDAPPGRIVARYPSPPTRVGGIVAALGLRPLVPEPLRRRLFAPSPEAVLVLIPAAPAS